MKNILKNVSLKLVDKYNKGYFKFSGGIKSNYTFNDEYDLVKCEKQDELYEKT